MPENPECKQDPGVFTPVIDRNRCEGKGDCVPACPYNVFVVGTLPREQRAGLGFVGLLKGTAHGWQQALLVNQQECRACGMCVKVCPEHAISLARA